MEGWRRVALKRDPGGLPHRQETLCAPPRISILMVFAKGFGRWSTIKEKNKGCNLQTHETAQVGGPGSLSAPFSGHSSDIAALYSFYFILFFSLTHGPLRRHANQPASSSERSGLLKETRHSCTLRGWRPPFPFASPPPQSSAQSSVPRGHREHAVCFLLLLLLHPSFLSPSVTSPGVSQSPVPACSVSAHTPVLPSRPVWRCCGAGCTGTTRYQVLRLTIDNRCHVYLPQDNVQICLTGFPNGNHGVSFFLPL